MLFDALIAQQARIEKTHARAGARWQPNDLVFPTWNGTQMDANNVRHGFRTVLRLGGFTAEEAEQWTPRELRHSLVSLLSDNDMPVEQTSRLVGHQTSLVTEKVYRHQIRPVLQHGARAMDLISPPRPRISHPVRHPADPGHGIGQAPDMASGPSTCTNAVGDTGIEPVTSSV